MNKNLVLGTMTIGEQIFDDKALELIHEALALDINEFDTAAVYNEGQCEVILGECFKEIDRSNYYIASKVNPKITGDLTRESVLKQANDTLEKLKLDYLDLLYIHFPDPSTDIVETLSAINELHKQGKIKEFGLSNFPAWQVTEIYYLCKVNNWILPTVYQGVYNPLSRLVDKELKPCLEKLNIRFYGYNPLAGGILTNKYMTMDAATDSGRFKNRPNYKGRYWKESYFKAADLIRQAAAKHDINIIEATYRWLAFHSALNLDKSDKIIIGVSKSSQLISNAESLDKGELPQEVVNAFEEAWLLTKNDAPEYFRLVDKEKK